MSQRADEVPAGVRSIKQRVQHALRRLGIYERLKGSRVYGWYWTIADRQMVEREQAEVAFYRRVLDGFQPGNIIFDIGANQGTKTAIFLKLGARVVAVEPDETNQKILRQRFLALRLRPRPVTIVGKAVSDTETVETMWIDAEGSAKNTLSPKWVDTLRNDDQRFGTPFEFGRQVSVPTVTLSQLIQEHGDPCFVKIDVEGFEPQVLRGLTRAVPCLSFEVNLPEFAPEGAECVELLKRCDPDGRFNFVVDCTHGLELPGWLDATAFSDVLDGCTEPSVEVFWRTPG